MSPFYIKNEKEGKGVWEKWDGKPRELQGKKENHLGVQIGPFPGDPNPDKLEIKVHELSHCITETEVGDIIFPGDAGSANREDFDVKNLTRNGKIVARVIFCRKPIK